jgi:hypothetical protein
VTRSFPFKPMIGFHRSDGIQSKLLHSLLRLSELESSLSNQVARKSVALHRIKDLC